jgi:hypothetical protein
MKEYTWHMNYMTIRNYHSLIKPKVKKRVETLSNL